MMTKPLATGQTDWREEVRDIRQRLVDGVLAPDIGVLVALHAIDDLYARLSELSARVPV